MDCFDVYTKNADELAKLIFNTEKYVERVEEFSAMLKEFGHPFVFIRPNFEVERYKKSLPYLRKRVNCKHKNIMKFDNEDYNPHSRHEYCTVTKYCRDCLLLLEDKKK